MKCIEFVVEDHAILRRALEILDGMVRKLEDGERIEIADVVTVVEFVRHFGVEYHQTIEEKILLPALLRAVPQEAPVGQMLSEHGEQRELVETIGDALRSKRGKDFARDSRRLTLLFRNHLDQSESVLRRMAEGALSTEEDSSVAAELTKNGRQREDFPNLLRLESKYVQKPFRTVVGSSERQLIRSSGSRSYS